MLKEIGKNVVKKGEVIFAKGEKITQIGILLAGKVVMQGEYYRIVRAQGTYLALNRMNDEVYNATYTAIEDSVVYALPVQGEETLRNIIAKNAIKILLKLKEGHILHAMENANFILIHQMENKKLLVIAQFVKMKKKNQNSMKSILYMQYHQIISLLLNQIILLYIP